MLKRIRKIQPLNMLIRSTLLKLQSGYLFLEKKVYPRWRLAGKIKLRLNNIDFCLYAECDDFLVDTMFYGVNDEKTELILFSELAKSSRTILDIGANTGLYSIIASRANKSSNIHAFEPYPVNFKRLKKNLILNGAINTTPVEIAVGSENTTLSFSVPSDYRICQVSSLNSNFSKKFFSEEFNFIYIPVDCQTLDSVIKERNIANIDLIKIDVESYEMEVFKGGISTLQEHRPLIFCEVLVDDERKKYFDDVLQQLGYSIYLITPLGLIKLDRMEESCYRTYLFSPFNTQERFLSIVDLEKIIAKVAPSLVDKKLKISID